MCINNFYILQLDLSVIQLLKLCPICFLSPFRYILIFAEHLKVAHIMPLHL